MLKPAAVPLVLLLFALFPLQACTQSGQQPRFTQQETLPLRLVAQTATEPEPRVPPDFRSQINQFIAEMVSKHGFDAGQLQVLFSQVIFRDDIIEKITRPAEKTKPWHAYRAIFLDPQRIENGVAYWREHRAVLARAEQLYGIPAEIILAIMGVETRYGRVTGRDMVLEALTTLAFGYPRRAKFFRQELENYLILTREESIDPLSLRGSYAGAMGLGQFMPSSYRAYAVDFTADGKRDLWTNPHDAIGSIANYLSEHGWQRGEPIVASAQVQDQQYQTVLTKDLQPKLTLNELSGYGVKPSNKGVAALAGEKKAILLELDGRWGKQHWLGFKNFYVITRYNHSPLYAMAVYDLSREIRQRYQ